jgi:multidrug efflux pump subunit AcrB
MRRASEIVLATPGVAHAVNVVGFSGATFTNAPNAGAMFIVLDPFEARAKDPTKSGPAIQAELFRKLSVIQDAFLIVVMPPPVQGIGNAGGFRMMVEDRSGAGPQALQQAVGAMMGRAAQTPGLQQVFSLFEVSTPQLYLDIDRNKAQLLGINVADVFSALQIYLGSAYVNDFNLFGRTFRVQAQADSKYRLEPKDVLQLRVRNSSGDTVPLGSFTTATYPVRIACRATTSIRRPSSTAMRRPATARDRRSRSCRSLQRKHCRRASPTNGPRLRSSRSAPATPRCSPSCSASYSCSWCWRRNTRA